MLGRLQLSFFSLSSDYEYLREHFREKHFLCEEGRCSTEQFTHAFRTEIDYKAHKTACHSKNRAEARQNRQIDLQFNYAPRHQRRSEGKRGWGMRWTETYSVLLLWGFSRTSGEHFHQASPGTGPWEVVEFVLEDHQNLTRQGLGHPCVVSELALLWVRGWSRWHPEVSSYLNFFKQFFSPCVDLMMVTQF